MKLGELIAVLPGCRVKGRTDTEVTGISLDSRTVRQGYLFAALPGNRSDGNEYVDEARQRGAIAVLSQRDISDGGRATYVVVDDGRSALARISDRFYGSPSKEIEVIGITGTNGKTTVAYLVRDILKYAGEKAALIGTIEYLIGERSIPAERTTPEPPSLQAMMREAVREGCGWLVMEVSSHALAQQRVGCVDFDIAVFTNLGRDHLDFHGDSEGYFNAKASLFALPSLRWAVINLDDPCGCRLIGMTKAPVFTYGFGEGAAVRGIGIEGRGGGSRGTILMGSERRELMLPLMGRHNVYNALAAAAVGCCSGISTELIVSTLAAARPVPGRLEEVACDRPYRVFIDYAHTDDALENVLRTVREGCRGRVILVFGCGGDRDATKRLPMGRVAARLADSAIVTSDNPRRENPLEIIAEIAKGFAAEGKKCLQIPDRREAIAEALAQAREGDVVLVAGKGHERIQELGTTIVPFCDRDVVMELLKQR